MGGWRPCFRDGEPQDGERALRGCTRIDLEQIDWQVDARRVRAAYAGRHPDPGATGLIRFRGTTCSAKTPTEDVEDGCPGGWRRNRFAWSLVPFLRLRVEGGARVSNRFLDDCDDELVWQLVNLFEREQERALDWRYRAEEKSPPS